MQYVMNFICYIEMYYDIRIYIYMHATCASVYICQYLFHCVLGLFYNSMFFCINASLCDLFLPVIFDFFETYTVMP